MRRIVGVCARRAASRWTRILSLRRVAERNLADRKRETRAYLGKRCNGRTLQPRQLAHLDEEDAVRAFRKDGLAGAPRPVLMSRQLRQRLRPVPHDVVRSRDVPPTFFAGHRGESGARLRLTLKR